MLGILTSVAGPLIKLGTSFLDNRQNARSLKAKLELAKVNKEARLELSDIDLAILSRRSWDKGFKDEYIVIVVTFPLIISFIGSIYAAFTGDTVLLDAGDQMAGMLSSDRLSYSEIMLAVIGAVLGIRAMK